MIRSGLRRLFVILVVVLGGTSAISAGFGALAGKSILHSLAVGFYVVAATVLLGSLALGARGPMRAERVVSEEDRPIFTLGPFSPITKRNVRKATPEERRETRLTSLGLFGFGILLFLLGAVLDPTRRAF